MQPPWETKIKNELTYDPAFSFLPIYVKKPKTLFQKEHMPPDVQCRSIYNSEDMGATQVPINRRVETMVIYTYNSILQDHKTA